MAFAVPSRALIAPEIVSVFREAYESIPQSHLQRLCDNEKVSRQEEGWQRLPAYAFSQGLL